MADCVAKGRQTRGEKNAKAKLTEEAVRDILLNYRPGIRNASRAFFAAKYKVTKSAIGRVTSRKYWKHVSVS